MAYVGVQVLYPQYQTTKPRMGPAPVAHHAAYVKYTGKFLDGTVFDTNVGKPDTLEQYKSDL